MNRPSIGITLVFILFIVPMLLVSSRYTRVKIGGTAYLPSEFDLLETAQVRLSEGRIYTLKVGGELYRDDQLFMVLPEDTIDFCMHNSEVYVLRPDGLYLSGERVMDVPSGDGAEPNHVLIIPSENPDAYILLSDGSCRQERLHHTDFALGNAESSRAE